ncbi:MAG: RsiV family protein [Halothermotrichaceae bacterium]
MKDYRKAQLEQESAAYPRLAQASSPLLQDRINRLIKRTVDKTLPAGKYIEMNIITAAGKYDTTVNRNEILSLRFENYFYPEKFANGITSVQGLIVNLITGKKYKLEDLFKSGSNYKLYLDSIIERQITEENIPLINEFPGITGNEVFYLKENSLVIVYQEYELSPEHHQQLILLKLQQNYLT